MGRRGWPEAALLLFAVLCSVLLCAETAVDILKKKSTIRSLGQCRGKQGLPLIWYDLVLGHDNTTNVTTFGIKAKARSEIQSLAIVFNLWKCDAAGNPDSCESFLKDLNVTDICKYMQAKKEAWSVFLEHFDKPLKCPIEPGVYTLKDCPSTTDFMRYMPITDAVWKMKLEGYDHGSEVSCVELVLQLSSFYGRRRRT